MKNIIRKIVIVFCVAVIGYSGYNLASLYLEYQSIDQANQEIVDEYVTNGDDENSAGEPSEQPVVYEPGHDSVDFDSLLSRNDEVVGWIEIPDTRVDYPVLFPSSPNEYLYADIDHEYFRAGSIFLDSRMTTPFNCNNTVIYGHNMKNGSMFHDIKQYVNQDFAQAHPYIYFYQTDGSILAYKVIGAGVIKATSEFYTNYNIDLQEYYQKIKDYSNISVDFDASLDNPVIMLSTCATGSSDELNRYVVHAILDKYYQAQ